MFVRISSIQCWFALYVEEKTSNSGGNFDNPNSQRSIFRVIWSSAHVRQCPTYPWKSLEVQKPMILIYSLWFPGHVHQPHPFSEDIQDGSTEVILTTLYGEDLPFPRKKDRRSWHTRQFFLTLLGRWPRDPFAGCWWPPMIGDKKVAAWITCCG